MRPLANLAIHVCWLSFIALPSSLSLLAPSLFPHRFQVCSVFSLCLRFSVVYFSIAGIMSVSAPLGSTLTFWGGRGDDGQVFPNWFLQPTRCTLDVTICSAKCEMSRSTFTHVDAHAYNVEHMCICVHKYLLQAESRNHSVPLVIFKRSKIDAERERGSSAYQSFATCRSYM